MSEVKCEQRLRLEIKMYPLRTQKFYGNFLCSEIHSSLLANTKVSSQSTQALESQDGARQWVMHYCEQQRLAASRLSGEKTTGQLLGYGDFSSPFLLTKFFQCPNSCGGAGWREESGEIKKTQYALFSPCHSIPYQTKATTNTILRAVVTVLKTRQ